MDSYKLALLLIRSVAGLFLEAGIALLTASFIVGFVVEVLDNVGGSLGDLPSLLFTYGLVDVIAAPCVLLFSKRLAKFAAKYSGQNLIQS